MRKSDITNRISILAPARGATQPVQVRPVLLRDFNSRPCERGDCIAGTSGAWCGRFQFSPLREGRPRSSSRAASFLTFQFSPLREGRHCGVAENATTQNFNSRPCERGDRRCATAWRAGGRFQFSPLREGRRKKAFTSLALFYFNSRPCERGDIFLFALQ